MLYAAALKRSEKYDIIYREKYFTFYKNPPALGIARYAA